ncbi:MAG: hypothetical protein R3B48_19780 [Kofleriaceae bacterium]
MKMSPQASRSLILPARPSSRRAVRLLAQLTCAVSSLVPAIALAQAAPRPAAPPVAAPAAPPAAPVAQPPMAAPVAPPEAAPVASPEAAPVASPEAAPVAPPEAAPVASAPPAAPAPVTPAAAGVFEWTSLRLLRDKGVISADEYDSAMKDLGGAIGAGDTTFVVSKLKATLYGFVQADFSYDSTGSCQEFCSNFPIQKSGTYRGDHSRMIFSPRDSRFGIRLAAPAEHGIRVSGTLETDFFGPTSASEQSTWVNPVLRVRHAMIKMETPVVDILLGQTWTPFAWAAGYLVTSVQEPGLPGQVFERTTQLRLSRTFKSDAVNFEVAVAALRPPQMDSGTPEGVAAARVVFPKIVGHHTSYMTSSALQPASLGISADVRRFVIPEFSTAPKSSHSKIGGGFAINGYLPIVRATKESKANALSLMGEFVMGSGTSDMYTALGAAGTSNAPIPPAVPGGTPGTYVPNFDAGFAAYDAAGNLELIKWTSYMVGVEFYPDIIDGRLGTFANYGHMQSSNSDKFGGAAVNDPVAGRTRESEDFYNAGLFFDPTKATRVGADVALYDDHYVDGTDAQNVSVMASAYLFF